MGDEDSESSSYVLGSYERTTPCLQSLLQPNIQYRGQGHCLRLSLQWLKSMALLGDNALSINDWEATPKDPKPSPKIFTSSRQSRLVKERKQAEMTLHTTSDKLEEIRGEEEKIYAEMPQNSSHIHLYSFRFLAKTCLTSLAS